MPLNRNHLTINKRYQILLEAVGKVSVPLTSTQIVHQMKGFGKYGYRMIEELCPREKLDLRLFTWSQVRGTDETMEMPRNQKYDAVGIRNRVFRKLTSIYGINWFGGDLEQLKCANLKLQRDDHENRLRFYYDSLNEITIKLDPIVGDAKLLIKLDGKEMEPETLRAVKKKGELGIYKPDYISFGRYLTPVLNKRSQELIDRYKNYVPSGEESDDLDWFVMDHTINNRRNWTYSLNIRGLMLYALSVYKEELKSSKKDDSSKLTTDDKINKKRGRKKGARSYNIQISKILENMTKNFPKEIPFLMFYQELLDILPTNFSVKVIKELAYELQFQLDNIDIEDLRYYVTKRYYAKITNHIGLRERISYLRDFNKNGIQKILEYRKEMLSYLIKNVKIEQDQYEKAYQRYVKDSDELASI
jgi:hypothetical protein